MNNKNNKGRGETNYGHQTAIVLKKVAMAGFVVAAMGVWFFAGANGAEAANRYRVGTGNWNTTASWSTTSGGASGASVPGSADVAIFEATSTASMTLDATVNVLGVQIDSGYTGTITQGAVTISVGTSGWTQNDGTFSGSSSAITITNGNFTLNTGTTTVPANSTLKFYNSGNATTQTITMASTPTATFTNNGTVNFYSTGAFSNTKAINTGNQNLGNVVFERNLSNAATYAATYTITGTMTVNNLTLTVVDTISGGYDDIIILNTGTIDVKGSYTVNLSNGTIDNLSGTSPITLSGEGTQTISGTFLSTAGPFPNSTITFANTDSVTGVTFTAGATLAIDQPTTFNLSSGKFTVPANSTLQFYNAGNGITQTITMASTPTATFTNNGTVNFYSTGAFSNTKAINTGNQNLGNVVFERNLSSAATYAATYTITGTMTVNNLTLTVVDTISGGYDDIIILNTGTIDVKGSYTVNLSNGTIDNLSGTSPITLSGEGTQTISGTFSTTYGPFPDSTITFANTDSVTGVTFTAGATLAIDQPTTFNLSSGKFTVPANSTLKFYNSGNATTQTITMASTPTATFTNNGTVNFYSTGAFSNTKAINTGNQNLGNVVFERNLSNAATYAATYTITGTMTVNNLTLTVVDTISGGYDDIIILNTGTIDVKGSYTVNLSNGTIDNLSGTSPITLSGEGTQTISGTFLSTAGPFPDGDVTVNKTGGAAQLDAAVTMTAANQDLTITNGTFDLNGYNITINISTNKFIVNSGGNLQLQGGETITAYTGYPQINTGSTVTYTGAAGPYTLKNYSYKSLTINGGAASVFSLPAALSATTTISSGILSLAGFNFTPPTFSNAGTLRLQGNETFTVTNGMDVNSGTVEYAGRNIAETLNIKDFGTTDYYSLKVNDANATKATFAAPSSLTLAGGLDVVLGTFTAPSGAGSFNVAGDVVYSGGTFSHNSGTLTMNGAADAALNGGSGLTLNNLSINKTGALNAGGTVSIAGNLTFTSGTLNGGGATINISGNWPNAGSAFSAGTSTVNFNGGGGATQTISGANTFYNLTKNSTATSTLAFPASATTTIASALTLTGTSTGKLLLRSSSDGTQWKIDAQGTRTMSNLDVKDSNNINGTSMNCLDGCDDSLNNTNWKFGEAGEFDPTFGVNGVSVSQIATTTDADWGKVKIQYKVKDLTVMPAGGWVTPSFSYSTSSGATWTSISQTYLAASDLDAKTSTSTPAFSNSAWATYSAMWDAQSQISNLYSTNALIKVTISDGDKPANAAVDATSTIAVLNSTKPVVSSNSLGINNDFDGTVIATSSTATLTLQNITGDSNEILYIQFGSSTSPTITPTIWYGASSTGALTAGGDVNSPSAFGSGMTIDNFNSISWSWTLTSRTETIHVRVRDGYNNIADTTASSTASWNNTPEFQSQITALQIATTTDNNWGKAQINFSIRDTDTDLGANTANYVSPLFEYNVGSGWNTIATTSLSWAAAPSGGGYSTYTTYGNATTTQVATSTYLAYTAYWTPPAELYSASAQVRLTINDNEAIFNTTSSTSSGFLLSSTKPVVSSNSLKINGTSGTVIATSSTATLTLQNITGDSSSETVYVQFATGTSPTVWYGADSGGGIVSTSTPNSLGSGMTIAQATSTSWTWTFGSRTEKINVRVRDAYNNIADTVASSTASWNNTPEFQAQITTLQIATTTDNNWGKVKINYSVRDTDTNLSDNASPGANYAKIKFEYSTSTVWTAIATSTITTAEGSDVWLGDYLKKSVSTGSYSSYTAYWNAVGQIPEVYSTTAKIRATVDDGEAILNTASSTSANFTLSTTKPVVSSNSLGINNDFDGTVIATSSTATITLQNITGDTNETLYIQFGSSTSPTISPTIWYGASSTGALTAGGDVNSPSAFGSGMTIDNFNSISWSWTLTSRTETIHTRVRDAYNNIADTVASSTASWNNTPEFQNTITSSQITNNADANWGKVKIDYSARDRDTAINTDTDMRNFAQISFQYSTGTPWTTWTDIPRIYLTDDIGSLVDANTGKISISASYPGASSTAHWNAVGQLGNYTGNAQLRVTINDTETIFNSASSTSGTISNLDAERPSFSSFTSGSLTSNNIQFTDADGDGVADSRLVTLWLNNLVESSSSTQGVYVLFSNDGTDYATTSDSVTGAVIGVATSTISNWKYISGANVATATSSWTLLQSGSRSKTVYMKVKDAYSNEIATSASSTITWNKRPEFSTSEIIDADNSVILSASSTNGVMARQCDVYDTDANCGAGKVKLIYSVRDPDANESGLATKGQLATTFEYSLNGGGYTPFTIAGAATTTVATSSADVAGGYNPIYATTTTYWDASGVLSSGNVLVRVTVNDNETGANTASSTSNTIAYDKTNPSGGNITFDAGVAGATNSAVITIPWWNDTNNATSTIWYAIADTASNSSPVNSGWVPVAKNATTTRNWTFDSDIEAKSLDFNFRDIYGNTAGTTTASTINPISSAAFFIQDVSKVSINDWKLYISWESSTSTVFSNYSLEYATSSNNTDFGPYASVIYPAISDKTVNYYLHANLTNTWYYRYRIGVTDTNGNTTVRSNAYINARPDGIQNFGEGGGGTSASASVVTNIVPTQGSDGNVTVTYSLTDSSLSSKTSPTYEAYLLYDVGVAMTASSTNTLVVSDSTKIPAYGFIQINQEVIGYTGNATSTGTLSGITRGTWPSSGRATRVNTAMASSTPVWILATSTGTAITNTSIGSGQSGSVTWTTANDTNLAGYYLTNLGLRVLIHDNQSASSGPLSSQSDQSNDGVLAIFDKKAPVLGASSLLINSSASSVEASSTSAMLSLAGMSGDTASETIYIQFASSTNWFGANANGTISATSSSWGEAASIGGNLGPWTWPLSGRSETVSVRIKDAYGNISNTDTNSIIRNAVPEFGGSISDADASGYATTTSASGAVIRQCNIYDTDPLCVAGKMKIKFTARDADTDLGAVTPGSASTTIAISLNGGAYATTSLSAFTSDGSLNLTNGLFAAATSTYSMVTVYYDPQLGSSANIAARVAITDNEAGSALQYAVSNTIAYDKIAPSGTLTFDAGIAGSSTTAILTIPVPTDATTSQYMFTATTTDGTASTTAWTTVVLPASVLWGFDSVVGAKSVYYRFRDIYGNTSGTSTASSLAPPSGGSFTVDDITASSSKRVFLAWETAASSDFANYRLEYATSSQESSNYGAFQDLITIPNSALNYYTHAGLDQSIWYRYRLSVKNTSGGNYSVKTVKNGNPYITAKPDGVLNGDESSANDTVAPTVTNVTTPAPTILASSAVISFEVSDNSSAQMSRTIYYAVSTDYNSGGSERSKYVYKYGPPAYVSTGMAGSSTTTSVTLTGLTKGIEYRYAVEVCDITGNCAFKEPATGNPYYSFITSAGPAIVSGSISAGTPTYDAATITWKTDLPADSQLFYSASTSAGALVNPATAGDTTQVTVAGGDGKYVHSAALSGLSSNAPYSYKVRSTDRDSASASYSQYDESAVLTFITAAIPTPTITVAPSCSVTDTTVTLNWTTDQDTTTEISVLSADVGGNYFNPTPGAQVAQYPSGTIDNTSRLTADYGKTHTNTFTGLTANTTYYLKARSLNRSSGEASGLLSCKTNAIPAAEVIVIKPPVTDVTPPIISAVEIKDITATTVTIAWTTDELADTLVKHGTTMSYGSISGTEELSSSHSVMLGGLKPSVAYNFKITSADARGNRAYAGDQSFTTLSLPEAAQTTKDELEKLQKELKELKEKQESEAKKAQSLAEATARFKAILKTVASDVSLQDLEDLTTDISDTISDITQEVTPPNIIGGVPAVEIEANKATIKWKTNKMANSIIALAPQSDYNAQVKDPYTLQVGQAQEEVKEHIVTIPDLKPSTVYHFQIRSKAKVGPEGRSRDFVFETKPELPVIIDYSFKKITENSITVVWRTNVLSSSLVRYTPFSVAGDLLDKESKTQGNPAFVQAHEVAVSNLPPNVAYLVEISSKDVTGAEVSRVLGTVRTIVDVKAPVIAKVRADSTLFPGKVEKTQTIIYWETDEPSTSQIFWKEGMSKGDFADSSRLDMEYTTSHVMVMTNFKPGSVYRFQVESVDPAGNKSRSTDYTVLTPKKGETVIDLIINNFQDIFGFLRKM